MSVVIPVFNGAAFLTAAVESALSQEGEAVEVVVVDDESTDDSAQLAAAIPAVICLQQAHAGPAAARNAGVAISSGEFIAFLDADDLMPANKLAIQVGHLRSHPEVGCVLGRQELRLEPGTRLPDWATEPPKWALLDPEYVHREQIPPMSMVMRRTVFEEVGPFDTRFFIAEDTDFIFRLREAGIGLAILDDIVLIRRLHGSNLTYDTAGCDSAMFAVLKARIDRRRIRGTGQT
ncbi:MAG TPA: glycosyltransferase [Acidimicrobiales bacterium]|nr:glycosyltransferase [Acidimicrobiales bacterium]